MQDFGVDAPLYDMIILTISIDLTTLAFWMIPTESRWSFYSSRYQHNHRLPNVTVEFGHEKWKALVIDLRRQHKIQRTTEKVLQNGPYGHVNSEDFMVPRASSS